MPTIDSDRHFEVLLGAAAVRERLAALAAGCTRTLWSFQPGAIASPAAADAARPLDEETLARGIEMRTIYLDSVRNDMPTLEYVDWLTALGAEIRTVPALPMRMLIVDEEFAVFPIHPDDTGAGAVVTSNPSIILSLSLLFREQWRGASELCHRRPRRAGPFNAQTMQAIELWHQGHTHESVARRMGVSVRTVYRYSDTVKRILGANSAFQAGARAVELQLIASMTEPRTSDDRD